MRLFDISGMTYFDAKHRGLSMEVMGSSQKPVNLRESETKARGIKFRKIVKLDQGVMYFFNNPTLKTIILY